MKQPANPAEAAPSSSSAIAMPLAYDASSEASHTKAAAISSGEAMRRAGICATMRACVPFCGRDP